MSVLSRTEYDALQAADYLEGARMVNVPYDDENALAEVREKYPKETGAAIAELEERGLDATPWRIQRLTQDEKLRPPQVGGVFAWTAEAIDRIADAMAECGMLTVRAKYRRELGLTFAEEQEMLRREKARKEAEHASNK